MSEPVNKQAKMSTSLEYLKEYTTVVADTGDFESEYLLSYVAALRQVSISVFNLHRCFQITVSHKF